MTSELIREKIMPVIKKYPISRICLFGSRASGTNHENSDVDLIVEFYEPVSLLTLSMLRIELEENLALEVDLVHGPLQEDDLLEVDKVVELYAA